MSLISLLLSIFILILGGCVQPTYERTVEFAVDMNQIKDVQAVGLRGDFMPLNWDKDLQLLDDDQDGVYTATVTFETPYNEVQVKFVKNGETFELKDKNNRSVTFDKSQKVTSYNAIFDKL